MLALRTQHWRRNPGPELPHSERPTDSGETRGPVARCGALGYRVKAAALVRRVEADDGSELAVRHHALATGELDLWLLRGWLLQRLTV